MSFDPSSIDWSDPIEANRQLKLQLAALEIQQGVTPTTQFTNEPEYNDDENNERYQDEEPQYNSRADYDPQYDEEYSYATEPSAEARAASKLYNQGHGDYYQEPQQLQQRSQSTTQRRRKQTKEDTRPKPQKRDNMTFSDNKCRDIDRGNIALLSRLSNIHNRGGGGVPKPSRMRKSSSKKGSNAINMSRKQNKIAEENRKFAQRLQRVRGTGSLSKKSLKKHAQRTAKWAEQGREVRPIGRKAKARKQREQTQMRESGWQ